MVNQGNFAISAGIGIGKKGETYDEIINKLIDQQVKKKR